MPRARIRVITLGLVAFGFGVVVAAKRAEAQANTQMLTHPQMMEAPAPEKAKSEPPPAVPGARAESEPAPAERLPSDMQPTEALFDAINRGDIATARDAISRGADLDGQNILGLTPLELAIDLGRNDISFMLLSLRSGNAIAGPPPGNTKTQVAKGPVPAGKPGGRETKVMAAKPKASPGGHGLQSTVAIAAPAKPQLFAGDGGTPVPSAGFLGFGTVTR